MRAGIHQGACHAARLACRIAGILCLALVVAGCSRRYNDLPAYMPVPFDDYENTSVGRFKTSYIVDQVENFYRGSNPGPIGVTTFVNLDDLNTTSSFGRMYAEQVMSELSMRGFDVVELRHSDALQFLSDSGEFALSRDVGAVRRSRQLGGVLVGTYVVSPVRVYVNARLVDPSSSLVLSAGSVEMGKTAELARMLRGGTVPATLERIPVKHLATGQYPLALFPRHFRGYVQEEEDYVTEPRLPELPKRRVAEPRVEIPQATRDAIARAEQREQGGAGGGRSESVSEPSERRDREE